jgi:hypothetical protein
MYLHNGTYLKDIMEWDLDNCVHGASLNIVAMVRNYLALLFLIFVKTFKSTLMMALLSLAGKVLKFFK